MRKTQIFALAIALLLSAGMWAYVDRVLIEYQKTDAAARGLPRGNLSDLYPSWLASRELLLHHRDPYSVEVTREIQIGYYGRPLDPSRKTGPTNQQAFAYPVYVAFLLAPTVTLPFNEAQEVWRWLLAVLTAASVFLWFQVVGPRMVGAGAVGWLVLVFATFPVVQGIKLQQLSLLVAPLIAGSVYSLIKGWHIPAGILLALGTIKPQLTAPLVAWLLLWAFSALAPRWKFVASFFVSLAALVTAGKFLLPGWIHEFVGALRAYVGYNDMRTLLDAMFSRSVAVPIEAVLVVACAIVCWRTRHTWALAREFAETTSLVLALTVVIVPSVAPYNQLLLLPAAFLVLTRWVRFLRANSAIRALRGAAAACIVWSWISAAVLATASFFTRGVLRYWPVPLWPSVLMPVLLTLCLALLIYFPPKPYVEPNWSAKLSGPA